MQILMRGMLGATLAVALIAGGLTAGASGDHKDQVDDAHAAASVSRILHVGALQPSTDVALTPPPPRWGAPVSHDVALVHEARSDARSHPAFVGQPATQHLLIGEPLRVTFTYNGTAILSEIVFLDRWVAGSWQQQAGLQVTRGVHEHTFDRGTADLAASGRYRLRSVQSNSAQTPIGQSDEFTISVNPAPRVTSDPSDVAAVAGQPASFSVAFDTGTLPTTIQWQALPSGGSAWMDVAGATNSTLSIPDTTEAMNGQRYRAVVTARSTSGSTRTLVSGSATLTVTPATVDPPIPQETLRFLEPPQDVVGFAGANVYFTARVAIPADVDPSDVVVTWQINPPRNDVWYETGPWQNVNDTGHASRMRSLAAHEDGYRVRAVAALRSQILTSQVFSEPATMTVLPSAPVVTEQPRDVSVFEGFTAEFSSSATGVGVTTRWQVSHDSGSTWADLQNGSGRDVTIDAVTMSMDGWQYRAVHANAGGEVTSQPATLRVLPIPPRATVSITPLVRLVDNL